MGYEIVFDIVPVRFKSWLQIGGKRPHDQEKFQRCREGALHFAFRRRSPQNVIGIGVGLRADPKLHVAEVRGDAELFDIGGKRLPTSRQVYEGIRVKKQLHT